jgi:hypothetical protein
MGPLVEAGLNITACDDQAVRRIYCPTPSPTPTPTPTPLPLCTTEGIAGGCPPGTSPDGFGFCCPDSGPGEVTDCGFAVGPFRPLCPSPVVVDVAGDGFRFTDAEGGVVFDINGDGLPEQLSWTGSNSDDAWLALDRDGDGLIGSGWELFGNYTPQPAPPAGEGRNGFLALAEFDRVERGGNSDGVIDAADAVFARLRLWRDANHDGLSEPGELHTLSWLDVARIHLNYKESKRADEYGNRFRYRAKADDAKGAKANRWAWDVFLVTQ